MVGNANMGDSNAGGVAVLFADGGPERHTGILRVLFERRKWISCRAEVKFS